MSNTDEWMKQLVNNYRLPSESEPRKILKESQLKHILNYDKQKSKEESKRKII